MSNINKKWNNRRNLLEKCNPKSGKLGENSDNGKTPYRVMEIKI